MSSHSGIIFSPFLTKGRVNLTDELVSLFRKNSHALISFLALVVRLFLVLFA